MTAGTTVAWILLVSGDDTLLDPLERQCQKEHLGVTRASSAEQATRLVRGGGPDVVALDLVLPDDDGFNVMRRIRDESDVPVILLSEDGAGVDEVVGLTLGADDVVPRTVAPRLFVARLKALLRRTRAVGGRETYRLGTLELDSGQYRVTIRGEEIGLTLSEFRLLEVLVRAAGMTLSRRQLIEAISPDGDALERTIDVHVSKLRRKLAGSGLDDVLETVRGVGYRAVPPRG